MSDWYSELPPAGESYPVKKKRKRRSARAWVTRIVVVVGFLAFMWGVYTVVNRGHEWLQAKAAETTSTTLAASVKVTISPGMTATQIGQLLEDKGVISSASAFVDLVESRGSAGQAAARAPITLADQSHSSSPWSTSSRRARAPTTFTVTLPEGLAASQIAGAAGRRPAASRMPATYVDLASSPTSSWCRKIGGTPSKVTTLEGLLFPDTYNLMAGDGPTELIGAQLAAFNKKTASLPWNNAEALGLDPLSDRHRGVADREGSEHRRRTGRTWPPSSTTASRRR